MRVTEILLKYKDNGCFILDSHQEAMGKQDRHHTDRDFVSYNYNIHNYNRLKEGSYVLFRRPKKSSKINKFYLYGGAIIESISLPDEDGFVDAKLSKAFKFSEPIIEDDDALLEYRKRKSGKETWAYFWNQYGMNQINEEDFYKIIEGRDCTLVGIKSSDTTISIVKDIEETKEIKEIDVSGFVVDFNGSGDSANRSDGNAQRKKIVRHFDDSKLNKRRKTIGTAGEILVLNNEIEKLKGTSYEPEYSANIYGDGLGYDISSYEIDGTPIHIEVKTTRRNIIDGFYMSDNEIIESRESKIKYMVYRVYNFNDKEKTASIEIYEGPITSDDYDIVPKSSVIYNKK